MFLSVEDATLCMLHTDILSLCSTASYHMASPLVSILTKLSFRLYLLTLWVWTSEIETEQFHCVNGRHFSGMNLKHADVCRAGCVNGQMCSDMTGYYSLDHLGWMIVLAGATTSACLVQTGSLQADLGRSN